jgi:cytochrome c556
MCASIALAQSTSPTELIRTRQQGLKDMGVSFKTVRDQVRQGLPDMAAVKTASENIQTIANKMAVWFPQGSGAEAGVKTAAKAEIWSDAATFDKKRTELVAAAETFAKLTASADKAAIAAGVAPLGKTCKGCHDLFFEDDK